MKENSEEGTSYDDTDTQHCAPYMCKLILLGLPGPSRVVCSRK
jgi:hypothetical protein